MCGAKNMTAYDEQNCDSHCDRYKFTKFTANGDDKPQPVKEMRMIRVSAGMKNVSGMQQYRLCYQRGLKRSRVRIVHLVFPASVL